MTGNSANPPSVGEPITVGSAAELIGAVLALQDRREPLGPPFWYRGQGGQVPQLKPAVLRDWFQQRARELDPHDSDAAGTGLTELELELNREFRRRGAWLLPRDASLVDVYFLTQHHGLPTRLLDWTINPLAALFFAATNGRDSDGVVVAILPGEAHGADEPQPGGIARGPFEMRSREVVATIASLFGEGPPPHPAPILPVLPDVRAGRMLQQGSCFTLHGPGSAPIAENAAIRLTVPREAKAAIERQLHSLGVSWATLFPDLDHLSREMRSIWQLLDDRVA
jgi:hypothetical protein